MASSTKDTLTSGSGQLRRVRLTRFRVATAAILSALLVLAGISILRMWSLDDLPDIGDPFDVEQARQAIKIPDADNAFEAYVKASLIPGDAPPELWAERSNKDDTLRWSTAKPASLAYLEKHRRVLEIWRLGSERSDCLPHQPGELSVTTPINFVPESMVLAAMAALEGSRLEDAGKMDEAWDWYRAILRSSRLLGRHGVLVERNFGSYSHELAARRIVHWASDPRVDAPTLRRALDDALAADRLTQPLSEMLKLEYLMIMRELKEMKLFPRDIPLPGGKEGLLENAIPAWRVPIRHEIQQIRFRASNEPERSRRVFRLIFANWLSQVDKPAAKRAPFARHAGVLIYDVDQASPPTARAVTPEELGHAIDESLLAKLVLSQDGTDAREHGYASWEGNGGLARERRRRSALLVKLAAELYRREQGKPAVKAGELLGSCLEELPEGVKGDDPIPERVD